MRYLTETNLKWALWIFCSAIVIWAAGAVAEPLVYTRLLLIGAGVIILIGVFV